MPDITMCHGTDCKRKNNCYRYIAMPDKYQSWGLLEIPCANNEYEFFLEASEDEERIYLATLDDLKRSLNLTDVPEPEIYYEGWGNTKKKNAKTGKDINGKNTK